MIIERRPADDVEIADLLAAQQAELRRLEADSGAIDGSFPLHDDTRYLVLLVDGHVVGCGALQTIDHTTAEIKRMYVRPEARGKGYARVVLAALEEWAVAGGHRAARVETGSYLPVALTLYRTAGYRPIPTYGEYVTNPFSRCFEKRLG
jgi:GNAT superfamily N-acetyltransferase